MAFALKYADRRFCDFLHAVPVLWTEIFMYANRPAVAAAEDYQFSASLSVSRNGAVQLQKRENARRLRLRYLAGDKN